MTAPRNYFTVPISSAQQRLWLLGRLAPESSAYNIASAVTLDGRLDFDALQRSFDAIVARHETLRTFFRETSGEPQQVISEHESFAIHVHDLRHLPVDAREDAAHSYAARDAARPFNLAELPLIRVSVLRLADDRHVLLSVMHHVISDGWSMSVFARELAVHYSAFVRGEMPVIEELPIQYGDFAAWQAEQLESALPELSAFWRDCLAGAPQLLELPADRPRPAVATNRGGTIRFAVAADVTAALRQVGKECGASLFMTLLAAFSTLLSRQSGQRDFCIGTPVAGRNHADVESLIGFFVNMLPIRVDLSRRQAFTDLVKRVRTRTLEAFAHQAMPFDRLVAELQPDRNLNAPPLFQVLFVLQNAPSEPLVLPGLTLLPFEVTRDSAQFDLSLSMLESERGIEGALEYACDLFDAATAQRLVDQLSVLLKAIAVKPATSVTELPLLDAGESERIVAGWNATARRYDLETSLPRLIDAQVARTPDAIAVAFEDGSLTYRALNDAATRLAGLLVARGVGAGAVVGVYAERSLELVVALCAIVKAGAAYCPLDPAYPPDRLSYMVETAAVKVILTQERFAAAVDRFGVDRIVLDREWPQTAVAALPSVHPDDLAYVLYTSGSTGRPKGVMVSHRAIVNRLLWMQDEYQLAPTDTVLQKTTFSFDVSVWEFFWPLITGARLVVAKPDGHRDPAYLAQVIRDQNVTVMHFVPSMLATFLDEPSVWQRTSLRHVICSGEALPGPLCERFFETSTSALHNLYGPTEAAVDVTYWPVDREPRASIPIGDPIANIRMHVLDPEGQPCPVGVPGELMIGGVGLARGYCNRPALTAERFVPDPLAQAPGARLYRTGDRARYLNDGALDFLGRLDHQIKLRGQRIELGEIESVLASHPAVRACALVLTGDTPDEQQLVAYMVSSETVGDADLRRHLLERLPEYMVPSTFMSLDALPLSPTGKLDRRALPAPGKRVRVATTLPRTETERHVAAAWQEILGLDAIDVNDNFFELGGHSLRASQVISRLQTTHGIRLPLQAMFDSPTVAALAARVDASREMRAEPHQPLHQRSRPARIPLSYSQERLWFLDQSIGSSAAYNLTSALRLIGDLDMAALRQAIDGVVRRHEILRTTFADDHGVPFQVIHAAATVEMPLIDLSALDADEQRAAVEGSINGDALKPFDLAVGPLLRVALLKLRDDEHVLVSTVHHIVFDGWSSGVLIREISDAYATNRRGATAPAATSGAQYADYAIWQRETLTDEVMARELDHWRSALANLPDALALPTDYPRRDVSSPRGRLHGCDVDAGCEPAVKRLCAASGVTPFMVYLAAYAALLSRYSGQQTIVIGTGIANREHRDTESMLGFFVNTLALRIDLAGNPSFRELVDRVRIASLAAFDNARTPFHKVVEAIGAGQGDSLYQAMFVLQNTPGEQLRLGNVRVEALPIAQAVAKTDLIFELTERSGGVAGKVEYNAELFAPATIERMMQHFGVLLAQAVSTPDLPLDQLPLAEPIEQARLRARLAPEPTPYPSQQCVHELFEEQAAARPDATALVSGDRVISYRELNARANHLAHALRERGVASGSPVGVFADRSVEMLIGLLAILKAGGAYVAFEVGSPDDRLAFMIEDSGVRLVLTDIEHEDRLASIGGRNESLLLEDATTRLSERNPLSTTFPDALAYVSYTSGSTGRPKGVEVTHRGVVRLVRDTNYARFGADETLMLFAPVSFDASTFEIWGALLNGGTLVIAPAGPAALDALGDVIRRHHVSTMWMTAGLFHMMADDHLDDLGGLRQLVAGGDVLSPERVRAVLHAHPHLTLINGYGPTEGTTFTCCHRMTAGDAIGARVPIGSPISNTRVYVVDSAMQLAPPGVHGELQIGGAGLARAYLRQPALTAERFVPDAWSAIPGERVYRSGDRVRVLSDDTVEFIERMDAQVKIRGFRVDLGEIESHLRAHPSIQDAVVIAHRDAGQPQLVAYVIATDAGALTTRELRNDLQADLPAYMLPSAIVWLEAFPLTENGKLDRRALPAPTIGDVTRDRVEPRSDTERAVAEIWSEVLGVSAGVHDDFFELGGHSLLATQVISRLRQRFSNDVPFQSVFECPTVAQLAEAIDGLGAETVSAGEPREEFEI